MSNVPKDEIENGLFSLTHLVGVETSDGPVGTVQGNYRHDIFILTDGGYLMRQKVIR